MSLQTFEEFFLSRLLTCPNFSFGSCRACRSAKEEEKSSEQKCGWQFQAIPSWQENMAPPPPAGPTSSCKMFNHFTEKSKQIHREIQKKSLRNPCGWQFQGKKTWLRRHLLVPLLPAKCSTPVKFLVISFYIQIFEADFYFRN